MSAWRDNQYSSRADARRVIPSQPSKRNTYQSGFQDHGNYQTPWCPQSRFERSPMNLYTQGSGEIVTVNSSTDATPRSQSIESNYTPSHHRRDRTPPHHETNPRGRFIQPPERTQRELYPPVSTLPVETPPAPAVFHPKIPRDTLLFYDQLSDTKLNQVRRDDPQAADLTRKEIFRRLALTEPQLQRYYELPVMTTTGRRSEAYVDFVSSLNWQIVPLFLS